MERKVKGIQWPLNETSGKRSTTSTSKKIWSNTANSINKDISKQIINCNTWRKTYQDKVKDLNLEAYSSIEKLTLMAKTGLDELYNTYTCVTESEAVLANSLNLESEVSLETVVVEGTKGAVSKEVLTNLLPEKFLGKIVEEKSADIEVKDRVVSLFDGLNDDSLKELTESVCFVMLGATSELCPLVPLLDLGFSVVAVSRPKAEGQKQLTDYAKTSRGSLILPKFTEKQTTGADVITDFVELSSWLLTIEPNKKLVIGNYIYLDGALNVQACLGMDFICKSVLSQRNNSGVAFLGSPGIPLPMSEEARKYSFDMFEKRGFSDKVLSSLLGPFERNDITIVENDDGERKIPILNGIVNTQGPSYCLAKSLQVWRVVEAKSDGHFASFNICPPCSTESVFHVSSAAKAMKGLKKRFSPLTYFEPTDCRNLMCILLLADIVFEENNNFN